MAMNEEQTQSALPILNTILTQKSAAQSPEGTESTDKEYYRISLQTQDLGCQADSLYF